MKKFTRYGVSLFTVTLEDSEFIYSLRSDDTRNQFVSKIPDDISHQNLWIKEYLKRENNDEEYYFVARDQSGLKWGTTRLYNFSGKKFELGSWVFLKDSPHGLSIKADILTREVAFETLGFETCCFEVIKQNVSVLRYHKMYHPTLVREDENKYFFELSYEKFMEGKKKFLLSLE